MRTIDWVDGAVELVDQTLLPDRCVFLRVETVAELVDAIRRLAVRGAPALGVAGAMGVALAARTREPIEALRAARPTAVNLAWGVDEAARCLPDIDAVLRRALEIRDDDIAACRSMGLLGADLVAELVSPKVTGLAAAGSAVAGAETGSEVTGSGVMGTAVTGSGVMGSEVMGSEVTGARGMGAGRMGVRVMTVCNAGGLAAVERGTALGVVQTLHEQGSLGEALALETRPLLQGARLTAWELARMGAPHRLVIDSAGPFLLARGEADVVLIGADRIAANGDTANKIGSYALALGARRAGVPFVVVAPETTIDMATPSGDRIDIEDRGPDEVVSVQGVRLAPEGTGALNPAFDVTPHDLITAIVTDRRVIRLDRGETLTALPR